jgi:topoisomerase-4 subunit A
MSEGNILDVTFTKALGDRYLAYALSTIMSRSLPDVRDGLKPVHRRLIYAMKQLKLDPGSGLKKSARIVGDVIGKFHPHGDVAIYDTLVRLAQEFTLRYPLIEGQGNFGNIDGDNPAAMRYTEARMTEVAEALLEDITQDTVDFRPTYDGESQEPIVLPANFPNLLANGAIGIAVGMATSIPPHNLDELCQALIYLIEHPQAPVEKLVEFVKGPDFPTGGVLVESQESILQSYMTGRGSFRLRSHYEVEQLKGGLYQIVITEIPYQVQKAKLVEKIAELLLSKKLLLLGDVRDESTDVVRLVLVPKSKSVDPEMLMSTLFKQTDLEVRVGFNMNVVDKDHIPRVMNLKEVLKAFLDHRYEVLHRASNYRLGQIARRLEILEGYLIAYLNLDEVIRIIRQEDNPKQHMMELWSLTELQADAILNMRLRSLQKLEEIEIRREHQELSSEADGLKALLANDDLCWKHIKKSMKELQKKFGEKTDIGRRRTKFGEVPKDIFVPIEAFIEKEPVTILCSEKGWIRAIKGHVKDDETEVKYKDGDQGRFALHAETTDKLLIFATNGRFYTLPVDKIPKGRGFGEPIRLLIDLDTNEEIITLLVHRSSIKQQLLVVASDGRGFKVEEENTIAQTKNGKQILNVTAPVKAAMCKVIDNDYIALIGENRRMLIFNTKDIPIMARGRGVTLQKYRGGGLSDLKLFNEAEGLSWVKSGGRLHQEKEWAKWVGKRGVSGRFVPVGFPRSNKFS